MTTQSMKLKFRKALELALLAAVFYFIARVILNNLDQLRDTTLRLDPWYLLAAVLFGVLGYLMMALGWHRLTLAFVIDLPLRPTLGIWALSRLGKYLPGKIFLLLGRVYFYAEANKSKASTTLCFLLETYLNLIAMGVVFLIALTIQPLPLLEPYRWWVPVLVAFSAFTLHPRILNGVSKLLVKWRVVGERVAFTQRDVGSALACYLLAWVMFGTGLHFVSSLYLPSIAPLSSVYLAGSLAVGGMLGLLAFFAPAGIGVREAVFIFMASQLIPQHEALVLAFLARLWMVMVEVTLALTAYLTRRWWSPIASVGAESLS